MARHRHGKAEHLAWIDVARDDLLALRRDPHHPHVAVEQQEEMLRRLVLLEDGAVLGMARGVGLPQHLVEIGRGQPLEGRKAFYSGSVQQRHASFPLPFPSLSRPRREAVCGATPRAPL
jgi:hypothetical protein